jgi:2-oxoisovalerate dehydrogenase E2 component (dihydrolipoyl transacylase)
MKEFRLPDLGEGLQEAEIVAWHVNEGDNVVADQPLLAVETDKAVVEVPAPWAGRIARLHGAAGDVIKVGAPLVGFDETGGTDAGAVVGDLGPAAAAPTEAATVESTGAATGAGRARKSGKATPAVRALARRLGVELALVSPTGGGGVITAADVERTAADLADAAPLQPLRGVRRAMAARMAEAHAEVAPTTIMDDADIDGWAAGTDISIRLIRAMVAGCAAEPLMNAWFDRAANGLRVHSRIDLGFAVNTEAGLFVPVLRDVGTRDAEDLRRGLDALRAAVEARSVPAEELRGASITLTNAGPLLGRYTTPVVSPPQVAILSVCRARPEAVVRDDEIVIRRMMPLSLTFDHRAVAGAEASRFFAAVIEDLQLGE